MKKIALDMRVLDNHNYSGLGRYARELSRRLLQFDTEEYYLIGEFENHLINSRNRNRVDLGQSELDKGYKDLNRIQKLLALNGYIEQYDLMFSPFYPLPSKRTFKGVLTIHDLIPLRLPEIFVNTSVYDFYKIHIRNCVETVDHIIVDSIATKTDVVNYYGIDENKVSVVYLATSITENNTQLETEQVLLKNKIDRPYILSVCTIEPRKNIKRVLEAFKIISDKFSDEFKLVLVGGMGWRDAELLKLLNDYGYRNNILMTGYVPDEELIALYRGALMMVYPSLYEGFGLPVLEAMSVGVPVVTSNISSLPEVGGDAVIYCDPYSVESIEASIETILFSPTIQLELKEKGIKRSKLFSWKKTAQQTREIFLNCLNS